VTGGAKHGAQIIRRFTQYPDAERVVASGATRSTIILRNGLQADLRFVASRSYGAALHYFTGSKDHNIAIRNMGVKAGLKVNEYGVFRGEERCWRTEADVYRLFGMDYIERVSEDREISALAHRCQNSSSSMIFAGFTPSSLRRTYRLPRWRKRQTQGLRVSCHFRSFKTGERCPWPRREAPERAD
jgi:hypothetical protein